MKNSKKRRLLVVDDATYLLFSLRRLLADMADEWEMVFMDNPAVALAAACEKSFDVILSDYQMPGLLGTDLVRKIKAVTPGAVCLIMTGFEDDTQMLLAMNEVDEVIQKPCRAATLRQAINSAIEGAHDDTRIEGIAG